MPKAEKLKKDGTETTTLAEESYFFPSVAGGIRVMAKDLKEATEKAEKIRKESESPSSS